MKKYLCSALALILILSALAACSDQSEATDTDGTQENTEAFSYDNSTVILRKDETTDYVVVYDDALSSSMVDEVGNFRGKLNFAVSGTGISYSPDWKNMATPEENTPEILVGNTNRTESALAASLLTQKHEFVIKLFDNGRIAIVATGDEMLKRGMKYFTDTFVADENGVLAIENGYEHHHSEESLIDWSLKAPEYEGAAITLAANNYKTGPQKELIALKNSGNMQIISNTTAEEFDAYEKKLVANGYELTARIIEVKDLRANTVRAAYVDGYLYITTDKDLTVEKIN